jgi:hypothetical protein
MNRSRWRGKTLSTQVAFISFFSLTTLLALFGNNKCPTFDPLRDIEKVWPSAGNGL